MRNHSHVHGRLLAVTDLCSRLCDACSAFAVSFGATSYVMSGPVLALGAAWRPPAVRRAGTTKGLTEPPTPLQRFQCRSEFEGGDTCDGWQVRFRNQSCDFEDEFIAGCEQTHGLGKLSFSICVHKPDNGINGLMD